MKKENRILKEIKVILLSPEVSYTFSTLYSYFCRTKSFLKDVEELVNITKKIDLDMAHALDKYEGKCRFIHGHTFHFSVTLKGPLIQLENHPMNGMVMDFGELKKILTEEIVEKFDHSLVLKDTSPYRIIADFVNGERINLVPFQPTCENLLIHFVTKVKARLPNNIQLYHASLQETPSNIAEWDYTESLVMN